MQPKYIGGLLSTSVTRKLDYLRAEEKMMQLEREKEGKEFEGKEAFVTQAYKDQMAEVRRAEEEEKLRDGGLHTWPFPSCSHTCKLSELAKKNDRGLNTGMTHFYRKLLEESEQQHEMTVAAAEIKKPVIGPLPNLTIIKPPDFTPKSDLELAQLAREQGKDV